MNRADNYARRSAATEDIPLARHRRCVPSTDRAFKFRQPLQHMANDRYVKIRKKDLDEALRLLKELRSALG